MLHGSVSVSLNHILCRGLPTAEPARPQVSRIQGRPAVGPAARSGDRSTTGAPARYTEILDDRFITHDLDAVGHDAVG